MENGKKIHLAVMRGLFFAALFISAFSILAFSFQTIYSTDLEFEISKSFGVYQNGVYFDSKDVLIPSPFAVQRTLVVVRNTGSSVRNFVLSLSYEGNITYSEPPATRKGNYIMWMVELQPHENKTLYVFGKGLQTGDPVIEMSELFSLAPASDKKLKLINVSNKSGLQLNSSSVGYTQTQDNFIDSIIVEPKKLNLLSKSVLVIFAGLVLLTVTSGFGFVFGREEEQAPQKKAPKARIRIIHSEDFKGLL